MLLAGGSIQGPLSGATPIQHFFSAEVSIMHLPGGYLLPLVLKVGNPQLAAYLAALLVLVSGYLDWALLAVALVVVFRFLTRKRAPAQG
ncbi:MAG: hypothetical protein WBE72_04475 [Terracidiphilus sp.]